MWNDSRIFLWHAPESYALSGKRKEEAEQSSPDTLKI
jgi:hypothetical protein